MRIVLVWKLLLKIVLILHHNKLWLRKLYQVNYRKSMVFRQIKFLATVKSLHIKWHLKAEVWQNLFVENLDKPNKIQKRKFLFHQLV